MSDGSYINDALKDTPFGEHKVNIEKAIDARMKNLSATCVDRKGRGGKQQHDGAPTQFVKYWWNMCAQKDWDFFNDEKKSLASKMTVAVERGLLIGATNPDEQAFKWLLAMLLACHYEELPTYRQIYDKLQELKQCYLAEKKVFPLEHLVLYPETATELPDSIREHAYTADNPPTAVQLHGINTISYHIPLRLSSKLLKGKATSPPMSDARPVVKVEASAGSSVHQAREGADSGRSAAVHVQPHADAPTDPEEQALWYEYQGKLANLRASRVKR